MPYDLRIAMIGAGNVAWHLAPALENGGYAVTEVYSRTKKSAEQLVRRLYQAEPKTTLDFADSKANLYIIAVPDDAITDIAQELALPPGATVVHTSGSTSVGVLGYTAAQATGVFYPLQTFSRSKAITFEQIPIFIESDDKDTEKMLLTVARSISKRGHVASGAERKALHVAAVFACNFTNHCLAMAQGILKNSRLDFHVLEPLIRETMEKSLYSGPANVQTGPARRHDFETLDAHLAFLQNDEALAELYRLLSQHIVDCYPLD